MTYYFTFAIASASQKARKLKETHLSVMRSVCQQILSTWPNEEQPWESSVPLWFASPHTFYWKIYHQKLMDEVNQDKNIRGQKDKTQEKTSKGLMEILAFLQVS